jgi:hypothetical protein
MNASNGKAWNDNGTFNIDGIYKFQLNQFINSFKQSLRPKWELELKPEKDLGNQLLCAGKISRNDMSFGIKCSIDKNNIDKCSITLNMFGVELREEQYRGGIRSTEILNKLSNSKNERFYVFLTIAGELYEYIKEWYDLEDLVFGNGHIYSVAITPKFKNMHRVNLVYRLRKSALLLMHGDNKVGEEVSLGDPQVVNSILNQLPSSIKQKSERIRKKITKIHNEIQTLRSINNKFNDVMKGLKEAHEQSLGG